LVNDFRVGFQPPDVFEGENLPLMTSTGTWRVRGSARIPFEDVKAIHFGHHEVEYHDAGTTVSITASASRPFARRQARIPGDLLGDDLSVELDCFCVIVDDQNIPIFIATKQRAQQVEQRLRLDRFEQDAGLS